MTFVETVEPTLQSMLRVMREKLEENAYKGHWAGSDLGWLVWRIKEEVHELEVALWNETPRAVAREAADVALLAMMVADIDGGLEAYE